MTNMRVVVALALTAFYVGVSLALGGTGPKSSFPWWFFVPAAISALAGLIAVAVSAKIPKPWEEGRLPGPGPRQVQLSWRSAVRLPVFAPVLLIPWHMLSILRLHFDLDWALVAGGALLLLILLVIVLKRRREYILLRYGDAAVAHIDEHQEIEGWINRLFYHFRTREGLPVSGRAWDTGYGNLTGSNVPVFYERANPKRNVIACAAWFEVVEKL